MKGKWIATLKSGRNGKSQWISEDKESLEELKERMKKDGSNPDDYDFKDPPAVDAVETSSTTVSLCPSFTQNGKDQICNNNRNQSKRCGYDKLEWDKCPISSLQQEKPSNTANAELPGLRRWN